MLEFRETLLTNLKTVEDVLYAIFSTTTLDEVHGINTHTSSDWVKERIKIKYKLPIDNVPELLTYLIGDKYVRGKYKAERIVEADGTIFIKGVIVPKIFGSSLVRIKPSYRIIKQKEGNVAIEFYCKVKATLPDGLKARCEEFMNETVKNNFKYTGDSLRRQNMLAD